MEIFNNFIERNGNIVYNQWTAWVHALVYRIYNVDYNGPASVYSNLLRRMKLDTKFKDTCCDGCLGLDACHFPEWNMPKNNAPNDFGLLHPNCHCKKN